MTATKMSSPRWRGWSLDRRRLAVLGGVVPALAGVVPRGRSPARAAPASSPRWRGWSVVGVVEVDLGGVVPALAGVVPCPCRAGSPTPGRPRAGGGGPPARPARRSCAASSPRWRGWSRLPEGPGSDEPVVPALAGVVPASPGRRPRGRGRPRAGGGGPSTTVPAAAFAGSSPRWRGWSPEHRRQHRAEHVVPALAGVVRRPAPQPRPAPCRPRAGGGGPWVRTVSDDCPGSSPRWRGWSGVEVTQPQHVRVVPALAGVVPGAPARRPQPPSRPRAGGGGPSSASPAADHSASSPRWRGWSRSVAGWRHGRAVVPALAGVVPLRR